MNRVLQCDKIDSCGKLVSIPELQLFNFCEYDVYVRSGWAYTTKDSILFYFLLLIVGLTAFLKNVLLKKGATSTKTYKFLIPSHILVTLKIQIILLNIMLSI